VFAFEVRGGSKEIDPLAGDEDFCRALAGDLFPSMRADFAGGAVHHDPAKRWRLQAFANYSLLLA
jgi:hypothetical protein